MTACLLPGHMSHRVCAQAFLNSAAVKAALNQTGSALAALTVLKKVWCWHMLQEKGYPMPGTCIVYILEPKGLG